MDEQLRKSIDSLESLDTAGMNRSDFLLTWERSDDEIRAVFQVADVLRLLRKRNIDTRMFGSGLGVSLFRVIRPERDSVSPRRAIS